MNRFFTLLLFASLTGLGQGTINCSLLTVTDVVIDTSNLSIDIQVYNGNTTNIHYPHIAYTVDNNDNVIQIGNLWLFMIFGIDTSWYNYSLSSTILPSYPFTMHFVYDNMGGLGWDTCLLTYNNFPAGIDLSNSIDRKFIKSIDILGRETRTGNPLFYIYSDGTIERKLIIK